VSAVSQLYTFDDMPPESIRLSMCDWLRHHGIDPGTVCVPGWIERRPGQRQIAYEAYALDEQGGRRLNEAMTEAVREQWVIQLEAEPSPFPDVIVT